METGLGDFRENRQFRHQLPGGCAVVPGRTGHPRVQMDRVDGSSDRLFRRYCSQILITIIDCRRPGTFVFAN